MAIEYRKSLAVFRDVVSVEGGKGPWDVVSVQEPEGVLAHVSRRFSEGNRGVARAHAGTELALVENYDVQGAAKSLARPRLPGDAEPASSAFLDEQAGNLMRFKRGKYLLGADMTPAQAAEAAALDAFTDTQARRSRELMDRITAESPAPGQERGGIVGFAGDVAANLPRLGRTMGVGVATGGFGAVPYMAEQIFGETYAGYRQQGKDPERAAVAAAGALQHDQAVERTLLGPGAGQTQFQSHCVFLFGL